MRIANAIAELRRPPSIEYSDHQLSPMQLHHSHSRAQSQTQSHYSFPGTAPANTIGHAHSYSMQSSIGSPVTEVVHAGQRSVQLHDSPVNVDDMRTAGPVGMGNGTTVGIAAGMSAAAGVGLGIALMPMDAPSVEVSSFMNICTYNLFLCFKKGRPSQLVLSSSDGALKESAAKTVTTIAVNGEDEDRGHMSDGPLKESAAKTVPAVAVNHEDEDRGHMSDVRLKSHYKTVVLSRLLTCAFYRVRSDLTLPVCVVESSVCHMNQLSQS